jgi:hypothetical protein
MMTRLLFCAVFVFAFSCAAPVPPVPQQSQETTRGDADITGVITGMQANTIRVEATPTESRGAKAVVTITSATSIRDKAGNVIAASALREGQTVSVWYNGQVAQSYPLQAEASEIRVQ